MARFWQSALWLATFGVVAFCVVFFGSYAFMRCWNGSVAEIFDAREITHAQSLRLLLAAWIFSCIWQRTRIDAAVTLKG